MKKYICYIIFLSLCLQAKVSIAVPEMMEHFIRNNTNLYNIFHMNVYKTEEEVGRAFLEDKVKFALIRSDVLKNIAIQKHEMYNIIGKLSEKSVLFFVSKESGKKSIENMFVHRRVSLGLLGEHTMNYLKKILKENKILYRSNYISIDLFHSLSALRREEIDTCCLFAPESFKKVFAAYSISYPKGILDRLKQYKDLSCNSDYCYLSYYIIATEHIGSKVMENIYLRLKPHLSSAKTLETTLGRYYIYTGLQDIAAHEHDLHTSIDQSEPSSLSPKFHRAPWMDIAIREAIKGKGSAENVLPMLDLSYKYIRFAKGKQGITTAPNDNKEGSWCAAYICWTLNQSGFKIHAQGRMASQSFRYFNNKLYRKIDKPIFGAITLYTNMKNPMHGHVGYLFGKTKSGRYLVLGGNQGNRLKFSAFSAQFGSYRLNGFYIPINYQISEKDRLTKKDVYPSARYLNQKYGIEGGKVTYKVR